MAVKYMDIREFQQAGYLQEVNRNFLHPLGLALEVRLPKRRLGLKDRFSWAWRVFRNPQDGWLSGIWDYRDDPEGMNYGDQIDATKAARIEDERYEKAKHRLDTLGYVIQPPA